MSQSHDYRRVLDTSYRVNWRLEDLVAEGARIDFSRPLLPEIYVRAKSLDFLSDHERLLLNHIRTRGYLALFELVESFVVPFMARQADEQLAPDSSRVPALRNFIVEEEKHRTLFTELLRLFDARFPTRCEFIGPADAIRQEVLKHSPIAVTIATLGLEWMSQEHYIASVRDDQQLDRAFKSILRHHWLEEAQHAKVDTLLLQDLTSRVSPREIDSAIDEYFAIGAFLDAGLKQLTAFDLEALEAAARHRFSASEREAFLQIQYGAQQWTFLGCSMGSHSFLAALEAISATAARRIGEAAGSFLIH
jgi:hypothetical protein